MQIEREKQEAAAAAAGPSDSTGKYVPPSRRPGARVGGRGDFDDETPALRVTNLPEVSACAGPRAEAPCVSGRVRGPGHHRGRLGRPVPALRPHLAHLPGQGPPDQPVARCARRASAALVRASATCVRVCVPGFAFINYNSRHEAQRAIDALNGHGYSNLILRVEWAKPRDREANPEK